MKDSILNKLDGIAERYEELEGLMSQPDVINNQNKFRNLSQEYAQLEEVVKAHREYRQVIDDIDGAREMETDPEMREMAAEEIALGTRRRDELELSLQKLLLPKDPHDHSNIFLEIRAGTGGDEAAIFSGDLFKMYSRYAETQKWQIEVLSESPGEHGGYKEIITRIIGDGAYSKLKHLIEPRIEYRYLTTTTDVKRIPVFDEVDSTPPDANLVNFVLANRLLGRAREGIGTRELASLEFMQSYSFGTPLHLGDGVDTSQYGPLGVALRLTPTVGTGFDARASFDLFYKSLRSTSLAASLQRPLGMLNLTWYESYNPRDGERFSSQIRSLIAFRKAGFPLDVSVQIAYDIERSELGDQRYGVGYQGSCWNISAQYRDTRIGAYPTREFLIVIGLKGVGALPEIKGTLGGY